LINSDRSFVCVTYYDPFSQLLRNNTTSKDTFVGAFFGSIKTREIISKFPKVKYGLCDHTHEKKRVQIENITTINICSDYLRKHYELIEI